MAAKMQAEESDKTDAADSQTAEDETAEDEAEIEAQMAEDLGIDEPSDDASDNPPSDEETAEEEAEIEAQMAEDLGIDEPSDDVSDNPPSDEEIAEDEAEIEAQMAEDLGIDEPTDESVDNSPSDEEIAEDEAEIEAQMAEDLGIDEATEKSEQNQNESEDYAHEAAGVTEDTASSMSMDDLEIPASFADEFKDDNVSADNLDDVDGLEEIDGLGDIEDIGDMDDFDSLEDEDFGSDDLDSLTEELASKGEEAVSDDDIDDDFLDEIASELDEEDRQAAAEDDIDLNDVEEVSPVREVNDSDDVVKKDSIKDIKKAAKRIIEGEAVDLGIDFSGEVKELLKLILNTKERVDDIDPTIITSKEEIPIVVKSLEDVNEATEDATLSLMEATDKMSGFYTEFLSEIDDVEDLVYRKDSAEILKKLDRLEKEVAEVDNLGFGILQALEFQDITEQKLRKVVHSVEDIGARIGAILGFIKLKQQEEQIDESSSQDDIDKLLADFGLG